MSVGDGSTGSGSGHKRPDPRPTLNSSLRRRRADRAFYQRPAAAMRQNERALERLERLSVGAEPGVGTYQAHTLRTLELADFLLIAGCVLAIPAKKVAYESILLSS